MILSHYRVPLPFQVIVTHGDTPSLGEGRLGTGVSRWWTMGNASQNRLTVTGKNKKFYSIFLGSDLEYKILTICLNWQKKTWFLVFMYTSFIKLFCNHSFLKQCIKSLKFKKLKKAIYLIHIAFNENQIEIRVFFFLYFNANYFQTY